MLVCIESLASLLSGLHDWKKNSRVTCCVRTQGGNMAIVAKPSSELARTQLLAGPRLVGNALTRRAGGVQNLRQTAQQQVVVDIREFVAQLPAVLHSRGFKICPVTLEVSPTVIRRGGCLNAQVQSQLTGMVAAGDAVCPGQRPDIQKRLEWM
jgi:hypothetical protein